MPRYAFLTAYDGAPFSGWQYQDHAPSVQGHIEAALTKLSTSEKRIVAAGRTDAGVHAMGQVFHYDFDKEWDEDRLEQALNFHLRPAPISILRVVRVDDEFSARFSAEKRYYLYRIATRRAPLTFQKGQLWQVGRALDIDAMQEAADCLIGLHDFTTFRSSACQSASPVKTLDRLHIEAVTGYEGTEIHFHVEARSFLHNQVRSFVGTLERVGRGAWTPMDVKDALDAKDRTACGPVAPACGLYLRKVDYPEGIFN